MSATRDKSQKFQFVYSNLYQIYRKGADAAKAANVGTDAADSSAFAIRNNGAPASAGPSGVLKARDAREEGAPRDREFDPDHEPAVDLAPRVRVEAPVRREVKAYSPPEFIQKRIVTRRPESVAASAPAKAAAPAQAPASAPRAVPTPPPFRSPLQQQATHGHAQGAPSARSGRSPDAALTSLKQNLKALNDLHSRLRFMLQELEELVKE